MELKGKLVLIEHFEMHAEISQNKIFTNLKNI